MPTLYLHIGTNKTGSTALRAFCTANIEALARRGYSFPQFPFRFPGVPYDHNGRFLMVAAQRPDGSFESAREEALWRERFDALGEQLQKYPNVILIDEDIWDASKFRCPGLWKNLKAEAGRRGFDVRIIVYLRRQDQFLSSLRAQRIRHGYAEFYRQERWEELVSHPEDFLALNYYEHLEEIASVFGRERIDVRVYDRKRFVDGDIIPDFLNALGLPNERDYVLPQGDQNLSLGGNALEIKRALNRVLERYPKLQESARDAAVESYAFEQAMGVRYSPFDSDELAAFLERYAESNRKVARDYLGDGSRPLFEAPGALPPKWTPDNPYMYESIVRYFGFMLGEQQRQIDRIQAQGPIEWLRHYLGRRKRALLKRLRRPAK